jgi:mutator protein MutT
MLDKFNLIAIAVIIKDNKILLGKKIEKPHPEGLSGKWYFPGGIVNKNETMEECLKREIREETGIEIEVNEILDVNLSYNPDWKGKKVYAVKVYFECFPKSENIRPSDDISDLKWAKRDEIKNLLTGLENMTPEGVKKYVDKLRK